MYENGFKFERVSHPSSIGQTRVPLTLHEHNAEKAGLHYDLRLGGKGDWAIRNFPTTVGERRLAVRQPTHPLDYYNFSGEITDGYGKGKVKIKKQGTALIKKWEDKKVIFEFENNTYVLINTSGDQWMIFIMNPERATEKYAYFHSRDDDNIRRSLILDSFFSRLKEIGGGSGYKNSEPTKPVSNAETGDPVPLRALNPTTDCDDFDPFGGVKTRAVRDMALNDVGF